MWEWKGCGTKGTEKIEGKWGSEGWKKELARVGMMRVMCDKKGERKHGKQV